MKFEELIVLLPCHSLEDFPVHYEGKEAEGLLAAWSSLWHPALLVSAGRLPSWFRADGPPDDLARRLIIVPPASESLLLAGWPARAKSEGAHLVRKLHARRDVLEAALAGLRLPDPAASEPATSPVEVDPELVADFLALGTCYLLVELLTRQMRYMSNIDEVQLQNETLAGARAAAAGQVEEARTHLRHAFEVLVEARERFYPVNAFLIDLTLVHSTTIGAALREELARDVPKNLLMSGQTLRELASQEPETLAALRLALDHQTADLVGGEDQEAELPLEPVESVLANFRRGLAAYQTILGRRPVVYGRRRFGLSPLLPQLLSQLGFEGALHSTLDDGRFPHADQAKIRWEGWGCGAIDALARVPVDAALPETMLGFSRKMGESMDTDHVATIVLAHWPGMVCDYYRDLERAGDYGAPLGKFVTLSDYFANTDRPGELTALQADQYRSPYLRQAIIRQHADPLSSHARAHANSVAAQQAQALNVFTQLLTSKTAAEGESTSDEQWIARRESIQRDFVAAITAPARAAETGVAARAAALVVVNPSSSTRRALVDISSLESLPASTGAVVATYERGERKEALVEVASCGFACLRPARGVAKSGKPLAEGNVLRNEFFEVTIHPENGGIRSIFTAGQRGNRLSQQLAIRLPSPRPKPGDVWRDPDEDALYSTMHVDAIEVTAASTLRGRIESRGRLLGAEGQRLAGFTQCVELSRGSRMIQVEIELDVGEAPRADAWGSYYAARFAWAEIDAQLWRSAGLTAQPTKLRRIEAPHFFEIRGPQHRTTIFAGGLPHHYFNGQRMLDSLLVVRGERERKFRLGIGLDIAHPAQDAQHLLEPLAVVTSAASGGPDAGWLFHLDTPNVVATHWEPVIENGRPGGFRVRLWETEGRGGRTHLRCYRAPRIARQVDFQGRLLLELPLEGDMISVDLAAYEWVELEAMF